MRQAAVCGNTVRRHAEILSNIPALRYAAARSESDKTKVPIITIGTFPICFFAALRYALAVFDEYRVALRLMPFSLFRRTRTERMIALALSDVIDVRPLARFLADSRGLLPYVIGRTPRIVRYALRRATHFICPRVMRRNSPSSYSSLPRKSRAGRRRLWYYPKG